MLALITLATWQVAAALVLVTLLTLLTTLWLHARHWSVKRLVMVRVYYKDGTHKEFITFPWRLEKLYAAIAGNPRTLESYHEYSDMDVRWDVEKIGRSRFDPDQWRRSIDSPSNHKHYSVSSPNYFECEKVLWSRKHALLVNVLRDFGLDDNQPMDVRVLSIFSNQHLDAPTMKLSLSLNQCGVYQPTDDQITYLERLHGCLSCAKEKKWSREHRYERFSGNLPGTNELVMELITTDGGKEKVLACIDRDWKPEPAPSPPPEPSMQTRTGGHC